MVLFLMAAVAVALGVVAGITASAIRTADDRQQLAAVEDAAVSAVAALKGRLAQTAALRLGDLSQADVDALVADAASLPAAPPGMELVPGAEATGVRLIGFRRMERIAQDERITQAWVDQPRRSYDAIPPQAGRIASETYVLLVYASVRDQDGRIGRARVSVAVSRVPPHQDALYVAGDGLVCASTSGRIDGGVTVDGNLRLADCGGPVEYLGALNVSGELTVEGSHPLAGSSA
jgi:hypothetical protein